MTNLNICVKSTQEYSLFTFIGGNRTVNPKNVNAIKLSMAEKQLIVPSIVNEKMEIIDGQHRFTVCKELNIPFYYIIIKGYGLHDVQRINANMANWTNNDFMESFIDLYRSGHNEYVNYVELKNFIEDTGLLLNTALVLSDLKASSKEKITNSFKDGNFKFHNKRMAIDAAEAMKDFEQYDSTKWKQTTFAIMFSKLFFNDSYDHSIMLRNLPKNFHLLSLMGNRKATITYLIEMYNYNIPRNKKLYGNVIEDSWDDMLNINNKED